MRKLSCCSQLADFDFDLPENLVAQTPLPKRSDSRLLCLAKKTGIISHHFFYELPKLLSDSDLLVFNNTQVIPARFYAKKITGGKVEILLERILTNNQILAHARASKALKSGEKLFLDTTIWFEIIGRHDSLYVLQLHAVDTLQDVFKKFGHVPLPPYIKHMPSAQDQERYQTIYAKHPGAVAAPTAGLHFDDELLQNLTANNIGMEYVTLHVGAGTFGPIREVDFTKHQMHAEYIVVPHKTCKKVHMTQSSGGKIVAVGTTSLRALEAASSKGELKAYAGETRLFIYPGYQFHIVDALLTNFHLPKTSLLLLVAAFAGYENTMRSYREAIRHKYRFYSYGDAMLVI